MTRRLSLVLLGAALLLPAAEAAAQNTIASRAASIRIGGRLQAQYATSSVGSDHSGFFFRRARLTADVTVNDFLDGRIQPEFAGGTVELKDAYLRLTFSPGFQLSMGQFFRAFDLFELSSSTDLSLIERDGRVGGVGGCTGVGGICSYSRFTEKLAFSNRDTGLRATGTAGKLGYQVTVTNGEGANQRDANDSKSFSGRVSVEVAEGLTVSGQLGVHDYVAQDDESATAGAWGADAQYGDWRDGLLLQASVVRGENWKNLDDEGSASTFMTWQGVASYYAPLSSERFVGIEPLVRLSYGDPDTGLADDGGLVFTPGLMFYLLGKNKIGFNVDVWSPQRGDTEYSLKVQSFLYF